MEVTAAVNLRTAQRVATWYLVAGIALALVAAIVRPGFYRGHLTGQITGNAADRTFSHLSLSLAAETEPRWCWVYPRNHRYRQATLTIRPWDEAERTARVDLTEGTWRCGQDEGRLDGRGLSRLLGAASDAQPPSPAAAQQEQSVLNALRQMRDGEFLRPQHHGHHIDEPVAAHYQHFTIGQNWGFYAAVAWLLAWPVYLVLFQQPSPHGWLKPRRAFLVTSGIVVALDLIFIGVGAVFSPGFIAEAMELLIGMLNMPVLLVLGDRAVFGWPGLALGVVSWSVVVSVGTLFIRPARRSSRGRGTGCYGGATGDAPARRR